PDLETGLATSLDPRPSPEPLLRGPGEQGVARGVIRHRTVVEPQLQQVPVRRADLRPRRDAQALHDLVPVQVGPDRGELLLLGESGDPRLELVVAAPEPLGLALVAGR